MYFDEAPSPFVRVRAPLERLMILVAALLVSPLGYLLIGPLGRWSDRAAGSIF
jgi:NADH-quinone oxidoreductase subunit N